MVRGSFHFRLMDTGNLIGEYFNSYGETIIAENSIRNEEENTNFELRFAGEYRTSWIQNGERIIKNLRIAQLQTICLSLIGLIKWKTNISKKSGFFYKKTLYTGITPEDDL